MSDNATTTRRAALAERMELSIEETIALPTVIEVFARRTLMSESAMLVSLETNDALRAYAKKMCAEGAKAL